MTDPYFTAPLSEVDPEIAEVLQRELDRQRGYLEMIASETFVPVSVLQSQGSVLTNKYAEGYPGRRYYGGCEEVDVAEELAIARAKSLFGAEFANVQPHSGATANAAVLHAIARPGDTLLDAGDASPETAQQVPPERRDDTGTADGDDRKPPHAGGCQAVEERPFFVPPHEVLDGVHDPDQQQHRQSCRDGDDQGREPEAEQDSESAAVRARALGGGGCHVATLTHRAGASRHALP